MGMLLGEFHKKVGEYLEKFGPNHPVFVSTSDQSSYLLEGIAEYGVESDELDGYDEILLIVVANKD